MIERVAQFLEPYSPRRRYLVGVSGGLDSVVLLHILHQLRYRRLIVVHLNHALRGRASGADAAFVKRLAKRLDLDIESRREDVDQRARRDRQSLETAAREARYQFFAEVARRRRCHHLFLAHHADDQVETVIMRLFRGTGSKGLGGMHPVSQRRLQGTALTIVRPLLEIPRETLESYAEAHQEIRFREDASNEDRHFLRNRIRHDLIPHLNACFGRDVRAAMLRLAKQCRAEDDCLDALVPPEAHGPTLPVKLMRTLPLALQRRTLHRWLQSHGVADIDHSRIEEALKLIEPEASVAKINLPRNRHLRRRQGTLFIQ